MAQLFISNQRALLIIFIVVTFIISIFAMNAYASLTEVRQLPTLVVIPSATDTLSPTITATETTTHTSTRTPLPTQTATASSTATATTTNTALPTATRTPLPTATDTYTPSPSQNPTLTHTPRPSQFPASVSTPLPPQIVTLPYTPLPPQIVTLTYTPIPSQIPTLIPSPTHTPMIAGYPAANCLQVLPPAEHSLSSVDFGGGNYLSGGSDGYESIDCSGERHGINFFLAYAPGGLADAIAICVSHGHTSAVQPSGFMNNIYDCRD